MLSNIDHIFFIGIKGVAMANLARILKQMGKSVSGSDVSEEFITDESLRQAEINIVTSFDKELLPPETQLVVYSASHNGKNNSQVQAAIQKGIAVMHQAELLGTLLKEFHTSIGVAGCHGKTTTSGLMAYALDKLTLNSSHMIGVSKFNDMYGGEYRGKDYFVFEADEYGIDPPTNKTPKFHLTSPDYALITNIDFDHPDIYSTFQEVQNAFTLFMEKVIQKDVIPPVLFLNGDDEAMRDIAFHLIPSSYVFYGSTALSDVSYSEIAFGENSTTFNLSSELYDLRDIRMEISLFGEKNVLNTTGVIALLLHLGFKINEIAKAIRDYTGAKRRFELKFYEKDIYLFDDYAHHPTEIDATITATHDRFPNRKLIIIFQPHTYSRTEEFKEAFVEVLSRADEALLLPIFASARESRTENSISSEKLVQMGKKKGIQNMTAFSSNEALTEYLGKMIGEGDIIFTMGAGDVYKLSDKIQEIVKTLK